MNDKELAKFLYDKGHFWNPKYPESLNVMLPDLDVLSRNDTAMKGAVASWQESDENFNVIARAVLLRDVNPDGDVGPVTEAMTQVRRCGMPDNPPPPNARFAYEDPELQGAVESMQQFFLAGATGSGSFPIPGCDPNRKNRANEHSTILNLDLSRIPSQTLSAIDEILLLLRKCMAEKGLAVRCVKNGSAVPTHFLEWAMLPGSTIGINYFPTPGTCNQVVRGRIDISFQSRPLIMAGLLVHEAKGHGIGLNHTRGGIMNASITTVDPLSWVNDPAERTVNGYFGGESIPLDDGPNPPSPSPSNHPPVTGDLFGEVWPAPQGMIIRGEVWVDIKPGVIPGKYGYTAKPVPGVPGKFMLVSRQTL